MRMIYYSTLCLALTAVMALARPAVSPAAGMTGGMANVSAEKAVRLPPVQREHWQNSTRNERYAFLIGLFSALEMERAWQGKEELPVSRSINGTWFRGLSGRTLGEINDAVDRYYLDHPGAADKPVLEVIGILYVKPALTPAERDAAAARYEKVRNDWESR